MARNTGRGYRLGEIRGRSQTKNPTTGKWTERDARSGRFVNVKADDTPFKGVRRER
jgi:hypothetical protein